MTAAASYRPEPYEVPEGGLASFLTATVGDWSDEALNADNYYDIVKPTADQLAAFGREEDDRIAHVATGETIIPMAVFEEDPALKAALFARMREMGIEPERYVVGNELNSINPVTGQPEFFLKKIFKGIKKAVKGVVKVFKKLAPVILSVGLNLMFPTLGTIASAALGSGIGTLVQGGSLKDAFKAALLGGAVGGLASGIGSVAQGGEFMAGVKSGLPTGMGGGVNPTLPTVEELASKVSEATPVVDNTVAGEALSQAAGDAPLTAGQAVQDAGGVSLRQASAPATSGGPRILSDIDGAGFKDVTPGADSGLASAPASAATAEATGAGFDEVARLAPGQAGPPAATTIASVDGITAAVRQAADPGFFASMKEFFTTGSLDALKQAFLPGTKPEVILAKLREAGFNVAPEVAVDIAKELAPTTLRTYGPSMLALTGLGAATGAFDPPEMEDMSQFDMFGGVTGSDLLAQYPEQYSVGMPVPEYRPPPGAANGGDIQHFPRKNGPIYGPGTETSDDIPAMLSDGEFVMTARAVRGAGNGSRQAGMRRMYDMMRTFEGNA